MKFKIILLSVLFITSCKNTTEPAQDKQILRETDPNKIQEIPKESPGATEEIPTVSMDTCKTFFEKFPITFKEFNDLYGYDEVKQGPLYNKSGEHLSYFFDCTNVPDSVKVKKCILICVGGKWYADAVGIFQRDTVELIKKNPETALSVLDSLSDKEANSVWYFLFDGPHPDNKWNLETVTFFTNRFGLENKQIKNMQTQFEKVKSEADDHGR